MMLTEFDNALWEYALSVLPDPMTSTPNANTGSALRGLWLRVVGLVLALLNA